MSKFWNFSNETETSVDLSIEGVLYDDENWMEWFYDYGDFTKNTPGGFRYMLKAHAGKTVNVRINSYGGDVFAGVGLYDALIEHKRTGGKVITNGEKVFSAAVMPFLAGDERNMFPGGMLMVHNPLTEIYGNSTDLREAADQLDKIKECIINIYADSTGIDRAILSHLMDDETEMTAQEAVSHKLATAVLKTGNITNISQGHQMAAIMNAAKICRKSLMNAIDLAGKAGRGKIMDNSTIKTLKDLREAFPELAKEAENETKLRVQNAVTEERKRIAALDALDDGTEAVSKIIQNAKETGKTAEEVSFYVDTIKNSTKAAEPANNDFMAKAVKDFANSGAQGIKAEPAMNDEEKKKMAENQAIESVVKGVFA